MSENGKDKLGWDFILCPECKVATPATKWVEREPYCEDCGNHDGLECPNCEEVFDHVWGFEQLKEAIQPTTNNTEGK